MHALAGLRAISLDLDDTLWPFAPIAARIEVALHAWFEAHSPATAAMFPIPVMRELRERVIAERHDLRHDLAALRRLSIERALVESGADPALAEAAFAGFHAERNRVECFPGTEAALARLAARWPLAALSNGNADLAHIGLAAHFRAQVQARDHGVAKPDPRLFHAACRALDCPPATVLHVGDHAEADVLGALHAGLLACWVNREGAAWPHPERPPHLIVRDLAELAALFDHDVPAGTPAHPEPATTGAAA
jgi:putative hydrolase of the HAD superfamily